MYSSLYFPVKSSTHCSCLVGVGVVASDTQLVRISYAFDTLPARSPLKTNLYLPSMRFVTVIIGSLSLVVANRKPNLIFFLYWWLLLIYIWDRWMGLEQPIIPPMRIQEYTTNPIIRMARG
eukprot:840606_1